MFRLFECCALSFFERFVLSFSLKIERFVSDSAEIWICGLYAGMIGYWLDEAQWGKGYMSEAVCAVLDYGFNKLGLTLISANCYPQNKRSQRVLEKMGFTYEGILHQAEVSYDDKIYDHLCYYLEKNNLK